MGPKAIGFTGFQMLQIVAAMKRGATFDEVVEPLRETVEEEAIERNREYLTNRVADELELEKPPKVQFDEPQEKPTSKKK